MPILTCPSGYTPKMVLQGPYSNRAWGEGDCGPCSLLAFANMVSCDGLWPLLNSAQKRHDMIVAARAQYGIPSGATSVDDNIKAWNSTWLTNLFTSVNLIKPGGTTFSEFGGDGDFDSTFVPALQAGKQGMLAIKYGPIDWFPAANEGDFASVNHAPDTRHAISGQWCFRNGHMIAVRRYRLASGLAGITDGTPVVTIIDPLASGGWSRHTGEICHATTPTSGCPIISGVHDCGEYGSGGAVANGPQTITVAALKKACEMYAGTGKFNGILSQAAAPIADPPVANFSFSQNSGTLAVQYTDTSTGEPTSWAWSFGDGTSSANRNPLKSFSAAGVYSTTLTATNAYGSDVDTASVTVSPIPPPGNPPVAEFTSRVNSGTTTVTFTDTSTGAPTSWLWNFGDSTTSTTRNPSHTYSTTGTYTVTLTTTNAFGSDQQTHGVTILGAPPQAAFNYTQTAGTLTIVFHDASTPATGANAANSWGWDFGDGSIINTSRNPSHTYAVDDDYTVLFTAINSTNGWTTSTKSITVEPIPPPPPTDTGIDPKPRDPCLDFNAGV